MLNSSYTILPVDTDTLIKTDKLLEQDKELLKDFQVNNSFNQEVNIIELHIYSLEGTLLSSDYKYRFSTLSLNAQSAGKDGASILTVNPAEDAERYGYDNGDVTLIYNFLNNLISKDKIATPFYIEQISDDRTELRALTLQLDNQELKEKIQTTINKLNDSSDFLDFKLNFNNNNFYKAVNLKTEEYDGDLSVVIKLYQPLGAEISTKSTFIIQEEISDTVGYTVQKNIVEEAAKLNYLKGPNFDIELKDDSHTPTQYFNFNELFSFPVTNSYYELRSLFNEKSANISVDHNNYNEFVHFSSAEERVKNFKYKLDLIHSYEDYLESTGSIAYTATGISGSREYYRTLIKGIVDNFDHYDRFLFYESGSNSWPKTNSNRPYINSKSSVASTTSWYNSQILTASLFDVNNEDRLINTVPSFIRDDGNNSTYLTFVDMIGQHFDNIWIYTKAVSDKYDGDNRLIKGISKDLVKEALTSFGINIKESNQGLDTLFAEFTGDGYQSGSETINSYSIATSGGSNSYLQPVPRDLYTKEVYKRIYHNVPLLLKSKGTERGIKALINCFGIPTDLLKIRYFGGADSSRENQANGQAFLGPYTSVSSSLDKIRLSNTGSIISGVSGMSTAGLNLSRFTSLNKRDRKFTNDIRSCVISALI